MASAGAFEDRIEIACRRPSMSLWLQRHHDSGGELTQLVALDVQQIAVDRVSQNVRCRASGSPYALT